MRTAHALTLAVALAGSALISLPASAQRVCNQNCVGPVCNEQCVEAIATATSRLAAAVATAT